jgi:hypothetical protein
MTTVYVLHILPSSAVTSGAVCDNGIVSSPVEKTRASLARKFMEKDRWEKGPSGAAIIHSG